MRRCRCSSATAPPCPPACTASAPTRPRSRSPAFSCARAPMRRDDCSAPSCRRRASCSSDWPGDAPAGAWAPAPTSYAPPPGAPYTAEDVTLTTRAGIRLTGTITVPPSRAGARHPAVVLITGSGSQDRDEATPAVPGYRPFREIADTLSRRGIVVLRLDDRGIGGSDAGPPTATSADFADDIRAAVAWLRARPDVDPARVGLVGHSEGAIIAPLVAVEDARLRAVVLLEAPAERGRLILAEQQRMLLGGDSTRSPAQRDSAARTRRAAHRFAREGAGLAALVRRVRPASRGAPRAHARADPAGRDRPAGARGAGAHPRRRRCARREISASPCGSSRA